LLFLSSGRVEFEIDWISKGGGIVKITLSVHKCVLYGHYGLEMCHVGWLYYVLRDSHKGRD